MGLKVYVAAILVSVVFMMLRQGFRKEENEVLIGGRGIWKALEEIARSYTLEFTFLVGLVGSVLSGVLSTLGVYNPQLKYFILAAASLLIIAFGLGVFLVLKGYWLNWKQFGIRLSVFGFISGIAVVFWLLIIIFSIVICYWDIQSILEFERILCPTCP